MTDTSLVLIKKDLIEGFGYARGHSIEILYHTACFQQPSCFWFDAADARTQAHPVAKGGRNAAWFVSIEGQEGVLRHYRRGGWAAKISKHFYLWTGLGQTRAFRELELLSQLHAQGLSVPRALAMAVWRSGLCYRAALLTQRIQGARPISDCENLDIWVAAGKTIRQMHDLGVYHADLNVFNILVDRDQAICLIDFDRCWQGRLTEKHRQSNLARLARSVQKVKPAVAKEYWTALTSGYQHTKTIKG